MCLRVHDVPYSGEKPSVPYHLSIKDHALSLLQDSFFIKHFYFKTFFLWSIYAVDDLSYSFYMIAKYLQRMGKNTRNSLYVDQNDYEKEEYFFKGVWNYLIQITSIKSNGCMFFFLSSKHIGRDLFFGCVGVLLRVWVVCI